MTPTKAAFSETIAVLVEKKAVLVGTKGVFVEARKDLNFVRTDTKFTHSLSLLTLTLFFVSSSNFPQFSCTIVRVLCLNIDAMTPPSNFVSLVAKIQASSPSTNFTENSIKTSILLYFAKNPNIKFVKIFRKSQFTVSTPNYTLEYRTSLGQIQDLFLFAFHICAKKCNFAA